MAIGDGKLPGCGSFPPVASDQGPVGLAEFTAALSLAADQAAGLSLEHGLRTCLLATRLARRAGLASDDLRHVYYTALLRSVGCTSDAHEQAELFGDEIAARTRLNLAPHLPARELLGVLARHSGAGEPPVRRAAALGRTLAAARDLPRRVAAAHCETAQRLSGRLSLPENVSRALHAVFEHWDGSGFPDGQAGVRIPVPARFAQISYDALLLHEHVGGIGRIAKLAGTCYDPDVAALLTTDDPAEITDLVSPWEAVLAAEPGGPTPLDDVQLDGACAAAADFADLKSPWLLGHSRGVAELAEAAAWHTGLDAARVAGLRRAALLHDLGRVVVPSGIWDRPGPLRDSEWEQVRLHAYHGERALARSPGLARFGVIAGAHHERLDGSGYHRGSAGARLPAEARLLAVADCYQAMTQDRPHRDRLEPERAAAELQAQVRAGRLDGAAVQAVLAVAGHSGKAGRRMFPAGLSDREAQVLALLARGHSNRQIAGQLGITPKTAGHHVEHLYAKLGVSTRAAAALFALEHGLLPA
jgi:HD-GYP domain-containing protein (c-di-GMP phosphodiesterase class II)/DNA-binding CsgD family transcriptional regulator